MKLNLTLLICLITAFAFGQKINCSTMELCLGEDKNLLTNNLTNEGFKITSDVQYLSKELADKLTKIASIKLYGVTLRKELSKMIYIIYNSNGKCVGYTFITVKGEFNSNALEKKIEALGYVKDNDPYSTTTARSYTKGKKHFVVQDTDIDGQDRIYISVHNVNPK